MTKYELPVLVKPLLPEDVKDKVINPIIAFVEKIGGKLDVKQNLGKKRLAYPIKKHEEGYYVIFSLELDSSKVKELERHLKLMPDVLRFMALKESSL